MKEYLRPHPFLQHGRGLSYKRTKRGPVVTSTRAWLAARERTGRTGGCWRRGRPPGRRSAIDCLRAQHSPLPLSLTIICVMRFSRFCWLDSCVRAESAFRPAVSAFMDTERAGWAADLAYGVDDVAAEA